MSRVRRLPRSLFWRVFLVNAVLLLAAAIALAASPATVSFPVTQRQLLILAGGLALILIANGFLLRVSLEPLEELARLMRRIDLLMPGQRLVPAGATELRSVTSVFNQMLDRLEGERRANSTRVVDREEEERRQVARELHDEVGQGLTALLLRLRAAIDVAPPELVPALLQVQELARGNLDEVRRIARQLRPTVLDDLGLGYAIHSLVDVAEQTADVEFLRRIASDIPPVAPVGELALYRIAQEALTNVVRHAAATRVEVVLQPERRSVRLEVHDDGRGMLYAADLESGGIRGMRERALAVDGTLAVASRPGGGTTIAVDVPTLR